MAAASSVTTELGALECAALHAILSSRGLTRCVCGHRRLGTLLGVGENHLAEGVAERGTRLLVGRPAGHNGRPLEQAGLDPAVPDPGAGGGGGSDDPGAGGGGGSSDGQLITALRGSLAPMGAAAKIGSILKKGFSTASFNAPSAGSAGVTWTCPLRAPRRSSWRRGRGRSPGPARRRSGAPRARVRKVEGLVPRRRVGPLRCKGVGAEAATPSAPRWELELQGRGVRCQPGADDRR